MNMNAAILMDPEAFRNGVAAATRRLESRQFPDDHVLANLQVYPLPYSRAPGLSTTWLLLIVLMVALLTLVIVWQVLFCCGQEPQYEKQEDEESGTHYLPPPPPPPHEDKACQTEDPESDDDEAADLEAFADEDETSEYMVGPYGDTSKQRGPKSQNQRDATARQAWMMTRNRLATGAIRQSLVIEPPASPE